MVEYKACVVQDGACYSSFSLWIVRDEFTIAFCRVRHDMIYVYRTIECYVVTFLRKQNLVFVCRQGVVVLFNIVVVVRCSPEYFVLGRA